MHKKILMFAVALVLVGSAVAADTKPSTPPSPQPSANPPRSDRYFVTLNGGLEAGSSTISRAVTFTLYEETSELRSSQPVGSGGMFDVSGGYQVWRQLGVGLAYSRAADRGTATLTGALTHPLFLNRPRAFSAGADGLTRTEHGVHLQASWLMPLNDKLSVRFSGGPSVFSVRQELARGIRFSEVPPQFNTVIVDAVDIGDQQRRAVGVNLGADGTYLLLRKWGTGIGAGVTLRYTRATVKFDVTENERVTSTAGGFQTAAGLRLRF